MRVWPNKACLQKGCSSGRVESITWKPTPVWDYSSFIKFDKVDETCYEELQNTAKLKLQTFRRNLDKSFYFLFRLKIFFKPFKFLLYAAAYLQRSCNTELCQTPLLYGRLCKLDN
jgi:hypothetical protein